MAEKPANLNMKDDTGPWLGVKYDVGNERGNGRRVATQPRILVVDDEARMRDSVRDLLDAYGYKCQLAASAEQALKTLEQYPVDLMLLDINMPGMSGMDLLKQLARKYPQVSVIIVSGETTFDNAARALRNGASDFLRKPYLPDDLIRSVQNALHQRRLEQAMEQMHTQLGISEQRHRFIVNNSPDIIYMLDEDGCFTFVNERITSLLGYTQEEVIGHHFTELVHEEDHERARYAFNERRTGKRASQNVELRLLHKDDQGSSRTQRSIPVELNAMGIYAEHGEDQAPSFIGTYGVARDISERKRSEALINYQLYHDLLTGLPNRALFQDRLQQAISQARRNKSHFALMFLDMDRFKAINDSYGHLVGDALLQAVARIMRGYVRDSDTLARIGGDEFNLLLPQIHQPDDALHIADKIIEHFKTPIVIEGHEILVSFSIGIAIYPEHGDNISTLIHNADTAMYHIKNRGKRGYALYEPAMDASNPVHPAVENDLRKALIDEQFEVMLQPQQDTASGRLLGAEALVRWHHPERGLVMPNDFIGCAEESGLIVELGEWVLRESCRLLHEQFNHGRHDELTLSVNISARQLVQPDFVKRVLDILDEYRISGSRLELEITENILMQDMEQATRQLKELSQAGIRIAVDDFGTGYSSLSYLQTLPLHTLKIDRSFISGIQSLHEKHSIVTGLIVMARELGLDVVAEGVETPVQLDFLKRAACPRVQGFLLGKAMPAQQLAATYLN